MFSWRREAEIEEVTRVRGREVDRLANYLLLHRFARIRDVSESRQGTARPSCVIFHDAVDDNATRSSDRRCRKEFSLGEEIPSRRASEFCNNKRRDEI